MAGEVRHPIDIPALERYIAQNVPEIKLPLDVKQFGFGQSNPTYQLTSPDNKRYVLRKKPAGKLLSQAAHKVEREYRVIAALQPTAVPVPRAFALCPDPSVLGTPFYIMSFVDGRIIHDPSMPHPHATSPREREALWRAAVESLAALHAVDPDAVGLAGFGSRGGFYARQLATWTRICDAQARARDVGSGVPVGPIPHMRELVAFFADEAARPRDRATLVHGDYKIDNVVFEKGSARVAGILDWEMSTIGHPLSDLANLLNPYILASLSQSPAFTPSFSSSSSSSENNDAAPTQSEAIAAVTNRAFLPNATPGLPPPSAVVSWYAAAAGWHPPPEEVAWACAFSVFRLAVICQGIAARVATRQASSADARRHAAAVGPLGEFAWELVRKEREKRGLGTGTGTGTAGSGGAKL
ncbi:acyl-CoA dehydrogenase family member 11 [Daldinia caldariorum]|uniref:acyl-CoA dehydrogenase family member 11 n=1 Tax=Daldinia caldariorum TaxID=326644 RepID=UPI002007A7F3|nr:acyl-CoA dehydrogenase family member 11 [Daldinia caldariorum]KAI1470426.1 acyl-CoA dehydrogenase family member 11 [Daldinia caldariorum]